MNDHQPARRNSFILTIWNEPSLHVLPLWRGYLEDPAGRRVYFDSLARLNRLLCDWSGWSDAPPPDNTATE